jgi:hypothetical protein
MRKAIVIASAVMLVASIAGFITSLVLNAFVLNDYDAYGEVPNPSSPKCRRHNNLPWAFAGLFGVSLVTLLAAVFVRRRR